MSIDETQFAVIVGGSWGGKLSYQGKDYDFKISGLTAGVTSVPSKMSAAGEVYDLKDVLEIPRHVHEVRRKCHAGRGGGSDPHEERERRHHEAHLAHGRACS